MAITPFGHQAFHAKIDVTASGANAVVSANAGHAIRVVSLMLNSNSTNTIYFASDSTALSGTMAVEGGDQIQLPLNEYGWMQTEIGEALNIYSSKKHGISGFLTYFMV